MAAPRRLHLGPCEADLHERNPARCAVLLPGAQYAVTDDPTWNAAAIPHNPALEVLELEGLDHSLQRKGDVRTSLEALRRVTEAVRTFIAAA